MTSDKTGIVILSKILAQRGISNAIISPGSRNAPITMVFSRNPDLQCFNIVDERSAAFFGLGMAMQSGKPSVLVCTSGSAVLNYAPAIAEAYYSEIPMIVITADRPSEWIDQDESQTIRQKNTYENYILGSFELPSEHKPDNEWLHARIVNDAINLACGKTKGPVHINVPLSEPLYQTSTYEPTQFRITELAETHSQLTENAIRQLQDDWKSYQKKLILVGNHEPDAELESLLAVVAIDDSVVVLTENTSNLNGDYFFEGTDKLISGLNPNKQEEFVPDLLVTLGQRLVSRRIKTWLRKQSNLKHWHIDEGGRPIDAYQHLTRIYPLKAIDFLRHISDSLNVESAYRLTWDQRKKDTELAHQEFLPNAGYSDLKAFHLILESLKGNLILHAGNSTPIRYLQLFKKSGNITYYANRGTSGIDGSLSTAVGYSWFSNDINLVILGDLSFFYDSNALWNRYLKPNLKIIVINNSGGGIFRIIEGPSSLPELEGAFEVKHHNKAGAIAKSFGLSCYEANTEEELKTELTKFLAPQNKPALLEIFTPNEVNPTILNAYFEQLKQA